MIQPQNSSQVSISLRIINFFSVQFAVRSGGHSPNLNWASIGHEGLPLDLQHLNAVRLSSDGTFASLGPGARWGDVYATLDAETEAVAGGREPSIGVGGLILGAGLSHVSNQFGLVADNMKNFEVVLANGSIVGASVASNTDLFWALKGGGSNFGIVTQFDLYTLPISQLWVQINIYAVDQVRDLLAIYQAWQLGGASDVKSSIEFSIALDYAAVTLIYSEPSAQPPPAFSPFFNSTGLQPVQVALPGTNLTYHELNVVLGSALPTGPAR